MDKMLFIKCLRCRGTMIYNKFYSLYEQFWGWKCLNCGEIVDPVILENRQLMQAGQEIDVRRAGRENRYGQYFRSRKIRDGLLPPFARETANQPKRLRGARFAKNVEALG